MPQSLAQVYLHLVWSTKHRKPFLRDGAFRQDLYGYLQGICANLDCPSLRIGGIEDHVHVLCRFGRSITIADLHRELKRASSMWVKDNAHHLADFSWQSGYAAFSISPGHVQGLIHYIETQEEHHAQVEDFQQELRRLCRIYGLAIDERYVWD